MLIRTAIVKDNNDQDKKSKIQVKILPELKDVQDDHLPWVLPYFNGTSTLDGVGEHKVPEKDSIIKVIILDPYWRYIRYLPAEYVEGFNIYQKFLDNKDNINEIGDQTYPQPMDITFYNDGSMIFRNTSTGEYCIYHNTGSYIFFDKDGKIYNYSKKDIKFYNDKGFIYLKDNGDIEFNNEKIDLKLQNTGDIDCTNDKITLNLKNIGDISLVNDTCTLSLKDTGEGELSNTTGKFAFDTAGILDISNASSTIRTEFNKVWTAIISLNTNLQSWVSTNCVVGSPVTPNPATLALFVADNIIANLNKSNLTLLFK